MAFSYVPSLAIVAAIVGIFLLLAAMVWTWGVFLDTYEHDPGRVRAWMFVILVLSTAIEVGVAASGLVLPWVIYLCLFANIWGGLDAVLRYPAAHDLESFFTVKQFFLLTLKSFAFGFGFVSLKAHIFKFLTVLLFNVWGLGVIYLMALPLDEREQVAQDDTYDVDLAVRLWQLARCPFERRRCLATCKSWWYRRLSKASESNSLARNIVICSASAEHRRTLQRRGRSV